MVSKIDDLVKGVMGKLESDEGLVEAPEAVLERIRAGLLIGYKDHPSLLDSINEVLVEGMELNQAVLLANHFLKYGVDIREMGLIHGLGYVKKIRERSSSVFDNEKGLFLIHSDLMRELEKKDPLDILEQDDNLEIYVGELIKGVDSGGVSRMEHYNFKELFNLLIKKDFFIEKFDEMLHSEFEIDKGQVTAVPDGRLNSALNDGEMRKVFDMFKCTELVVIDDYHYVFLDIERELDMMNEHAMRAYWGPFDEDEEKYFFGVIDRSNCHDFIKRRLCHDLWLEGKGKKVYQKYMKYQKMRLVGIDESKTRIWLSIVKTSINCLLDQGYDLLKVIGVVEEELNLFENRPTAILKNLKPILERNYKG